MAPGRIVRPTGRYYQAAMATLACLYFLLACASAFAKVKMDKLLTSDQLAAVLGVSVQTLYNRRTRGEPLPPCVKVGRLLRYEQTEVLAWVASQRETSHVQQVALSKQRPATTPQVARRRGRPAKAEQIRRRLLEQRD
ncbi:helix-turn-helix transcriptional regulator [Achromobacter sp. AGC78]